VGVAAPRFTWYSADVYLPLKLTQDPVPIYIVNFRLKPGDSLAAANAKLQPLMEQLAKDTPKHFPEHFQVHVQKLNDWVVKQMGGTLYLLLGGVALLLAIGCGNVSILLLARGTVRQHELSVRSAIGASRGRIVRQLLTESLLLATTGAALGVLAAYGILAGIRVLLPRYAFAPEVAIGINLPVLFFSIGVALLTGVLFGLWPALQLSRPQVGQMMQSSARRLAGSVGGRRSHNMLISGQIALTMLLLAGAAASMEGFVRMIHMPLGYDPHHVISIWIPLHNDSLTGWAARSAYFEQLLAKVSDTPGVTAAAISSNATPPRNGWNTRFEILGPRRSSNNRMPWSIMWGRPILRLCVFRCCGDGYGTSRRTTGERMWWLSTKPWLGSTFRTAMPSVTPSNYPASKNRPPIVLSAPGIADSWLQIVGIVGDDRDAGLREPIKPEAFVPWTLCMREYTEILVRSEVPPLSLLHTIRLD
jgi:hypothetical protein